MKSQILKIYLLLLILVATDGYRILGLYPLPARSHFNLNNAVMKSLAEAGHEVVVVTPFVNQPPLKNYRTIDVSQNVTFHINNSTLEYLSQRTIYTLWNDIAYADIKHCNRVMKNEEIQKMFQSEKLFDVIFVEMLGVYECLTPLAQKWGIPVIGTISLMSWNVPEYSISNPRFPATTPVEHGYAWRLNTIYRRFRNTLSHLWNDFVWLHFVDRAGREFYNAHVEVLSPYKEYRNIKPSLVFFNSHFSILPRALNPNAIEIGGIHVPDVKPLPPNIKKFIDGADRGLILFTLGSLVKASSLRNKTVFAFKEAFRVIPQRVIWKYEDPMDDVPKNVMILPWIPQRDILAHHKVKAVISHCGISGLYEIIHSEKPVIATPTFADQLTNANFLEDKGVAIKINILSANKHEIITALNSIINDTRYSLNMKRLSRIFKDRPMTPKDTVAYWTEYIINYGGASHLQTPASKLYWFQYLLLDILVGLVVTLVSGVFVIIWALNKVRDLFLDGNNCKSKLVVKKKEL